MDYNDLPPRDPRKFGGKQSLGGRRSAERLTPDQLSERARRGGVAVTAAYGQDYFRALGSVRKAREAL